MKRGRIIAAGAVLAMCVWRPMVDAVSADAEDSGEARNLVVRAQALTNIRAPGSRPFRLQARVQLYDARDHGLEGTYTLLWKSPTAWRDETHAGDFSQVRTVDGSRLYLNRTPAALFPGAYHLLRVLEFPDFPVFPRNMIWSNITAKYDEHRGESKIEIRVAGKLYKTLYLNVPSGVPTRVEYHSVDPKHTYMFEKYAAFGDHQFPGVLTELNPGKPPIRVQVKELAEASPDASSLAPPPGAKWMPWCANPVPPMIQGLPSPIYFPYRGVPPRSAIYAIVGPDGLLHNVTVVRSTDAEVDAILLKSMGQWRYVPAKCGDDSVPWEMVIEFPSEGFQLIE